MSYLYDGETHDNYAPAFMAALGMSEETIASVLAQCDYERTDGQLARRRMAYVAESDPLFLEWQYDKTPAAEQTWRDKVAEIKSRYPVAGDGATE
ncbi:hypothetical protein JD514_05340 [Aeromonas caviae]|uniref:hypothetical protein n=1 Tax=Aeromonas caviae TaxID=648 RepID=UPI00191D17A7|nr:hypothetical protein [Aeromonas caviae]MBL0496548.1 hypothetical protein [Aeromonas caviae]